MMVEQNSVVCVVEDDSALRDSLAALLASKYLVARCFSSADDFLRAEIHQTCDFLIVDLRLPGMSGIELLEQTVRLLSLPGDS